jgi:glutathione peroxidase
MKNRFIILLAGLLAVAYLAASRSAVHAGQDQTTRQKGSDSTMITQTGLQEIPFQTIAGDSTSLADFSGHVVLIVNVASKCGNTPQYAGLEKLYSQFRDSGLVVIGFPANNFGGQEPGTNEEILKFCTSTYDVTFPMMAKVSVKGPDKHPLFVALTEHSPIPGEITWNFAKFLLDRDGKLVARFDPKTQPLSDEVLKAVREAL